MPACETITVLRGQNALVTGRKFWNCEAVAISLGQAGANSLSTTLQGMKKLRKWIDKIKSFGVDSYAHKADVAKEHEVVDMFQKHVQKWAPSIF